MGKIHGVEIARSHYFKVFAWRSKSTYLSNMVVFCVPLVQIGNSRQYFRQLLTKFIRRHDVSHVTYGIHNSQSDLGNLDKTNRVRVQVDFAS